jgi:hypothetical protein
VLFEIGSGAVSGSATDQPKLQDGVEAELETRFGLFSSTQDHAQADRRTLADYQYRSPSNETGLFRVVAQVVTDG